MSGRLWRITARHFTCGLVVDGDVVTEAPPILSRWRGQAWTVVWARMARLGWHGEPCGEGT